MMLKAIDLINSGLRINLGANWLQEVLAMMRYLVLPVVGLLFLLQVITALLARSPRGLWRAVWGSALGLILGSACAVLTAGVLLIVDQFSAYLLGTRQATAQDGIKKAFAMDGAIEGSGWLVVTVIAALGILAWVMIIVVLFLRKAMIIGTVVFGPFAMAGLASGKTKSWAIKWVEVVLALALSKFVICAILTLAYSAVAASVTGDITDALLGSVWVLLAAFSPWPCCGSRTSPATRSPAANTSGAAGAWGNARQAGQPGQGRGASGAAASSAAPPGGSPAEPAAAAAKRAPRARPAPSADTAAGTRRHGSPGTATGSSGSGRKPHHRNGCGRSGRPQRGDRRQVRTRPPAAVASAGTRAVGPGRTVSARDAQAPRGATRCPGPARDGCTTSPMPRRTVRERGRYASSRGRPARRAAVPGRPDVHARTRARGVLGPQQQDGARRVFAAPVDRRRRGSGMTTTTEKSTPRNSPAARRSRRGLIMNLSAAQAITLLVAVLLVAVCDSAVRCRRPRSGSACCVGGPLVAVALVRRDGFPLVEWAPIVWHFWRRQVDPAVRVPGDRRTPGCGEARAARGGGPAVDVDRTGRVGGGARPVDRRVHLDHAGPGAGVPAAGPGNPGRPGVRVGPGAGRVVPVQPDQPRPGPRTVRPRLR